MSANPCAICKGACCESLVFPAPAFTREGDFFSVRGERVDSGRVEVESRCPKLCNKGRCTIHHTRPAVCRAYKVGGIHCRQTIDRRRSSEHRVEILLALEALETDLDTDS